MSATFEKAPHPRSNYVAVIDFSMFLIECQYMPETSVKSRTMSVGARKLACVRSPLAGATN